MSMHRPQPTPRVPTQPEGVEIASYSTYIEAQRAVDFLGEKGFAVQNVTIVGTGLRSIERVTGRMSYGRAAIAGAGSGAWFGLFVGLLMSMFGGAAGAQGGAVLIGVGLGAGFGLLFSVLSYTITRRQRDFTSSSQIVAASYALLCIASVAVEARGILAQSPGGVGGAPVVGAQPGTKPPAQGPASTQVQVPASQQPPPPAPSLHAGDPYAVIPALDPQSKSDAPAASPTADATGKAPEPAQAPTEPKPIDSRWLTEDGRPKYGAMAPEATAEGDAPSASNEQSS
jgi:hypothetical protein